MTNSELEVRLHALVKEERRVGQEILVLVREGERRRLYIDKGYPSAFEWLVKGFGYSHSAAYRRIQAARALRDVPELGEKLREGAVNLTTLAQLQSTIQRQEKLDGKQVPLALKRELAKGIEGKSSEETHRLLVTHFPQAAKRPESLRAISADETRLSVVLDQETVGLLQRAKERLSHAEPNAGWAQIIKYILKEFIKRAEGLRSKAARVVTQLAGVPLPATQGAAAAAATAEGGGDRGALPAGLRRAVLRRSDYTCEFVDRDTGRVCGSRYQIEVDHIVPRALGGTDAMENLRCLCRVHNLAMAEKELGEELMSRYWPRR